MDASQVAVIGVSAGGLIALRTILSGLPADFCMATVIVQHRAKDSAALTELLQECSKLEVCEVEDKQAILANHVYLGPPDYHLMLERGFFALSTDEPVVFSRPSIDVMFESAAEAYRDKVVGVVLTGANRDGSRGLKRIVERGGQAIIQNPDSAEVRVMPAAAMSEVPGARVAELAEIPGLLVGMQEPRHAPCSEDGR